MTQTTKQSENKTELYKFSFLPETISHLTVCRKEPAQNIVKVRDPHGIYYLCGQACRLGNSASAQTSRPPNCPLSLLLQRC